MYRKINKGRSITKILAYSLILTWFMVILVENRRSMRLSWFKEVWEFVDFKAVGLYIEDHLGIYVVFCAGIVTVYQVVSMFARAGRDDGAHYDDHFEEHEDSSAEYLAQRQAEREEDLINNPAYHHLPGNIWHQKMKRKDEDEEQ
jgi:hypothetical protein